MNILRRAITMAARRTLSCSVPEDPPDMLRTDSKVSPAHDSGASRLRGGKQKEDVPAVADD